MKTVFSILIINLFFVFTIQSQDPKKLNTFTNITPLELKKMSDTDPTAVIIDVRTKKEFKKGHLRNAVNAKDSKVLNQITDSLDLDQPLLVYCDEGTRSFTACIILVEKGFINVYNLETGLIGWKESDFELTKK